MPCLQSDTRCDDTLMFRLTCFTRRFPYFDKLWLMLGQLEERQGRTEAARQVLSLFSRLEFLFLASLCIQCCKTAPF